jgi:ribosomal protein S18 acetylase RimI-like enzyme
MIGPAPESIHDKLIKIGKTSEYTAHFSNRVMFSTPAAYEKGWIRAYYDEDGEPVGFYCVRQKSRGDKETMLYFFAVLPEYRSKGIGKLLMDDMKANSPSGLIRLNVDKKNRAVDFYEREGFKVISSEALKGHGYTMEWKGRYDY